MKKNDNLVIDKRRLARVPVSTDGEELQLVNENPHVPAEYQGPGMAIEGVKALEEARPQPEFAVAPIVSAEAIAQIEQVLKENKIRVPRGWLLLKKLPPGQKFGSIIIPDVCQKDVQFGIVLLVGKGEYQNGIEIPPDVNPGNHVEFPPFGGIDKQLLGADVIMIRQDEVMLISGD